MRHRLPPMRDGGWTTGLETAAAVSHHTGLGAERCWNGRPERVRVP